MSDDGADQETEPAEDDEVDVENPVGLTPVLALDTTILTPAHKPRDQTPIFFLSLFLLLLAFFILLNAISSFDDIKTRKVIDSVRSTFRSTIAPSISSELLVSTEGRIPEPEQLLAELERLWLTAIPVAQVKILTPGRALQLTLPANELFIGQETTMRSDRSALLRATGQVINLSPQGFLTDVQFFADVDSVSADGTDRRDFLPFGRATAFAVRLGEAGAPRDSISVGLHDGEAKSVTLRFFVRQRDRARLRFSAADDRQPDLVTPGRGGPLP